MNHVLLQIPDPKKEGKFLLKKECHIPSTWNELSRKQLLRVASLLNRPWPDTWSCRLALIRTLLPLPQSLFLSLTPEQIAMELKPLTEWLLDSNTLTNQLLPYIRLGWRGRFRKLYGPESKFLNLCGAEFNKAEQIFQLYQTKKDPKLLNGLVAVLYRPKRKGYNPHSPDTTGDPRQPYNKHLLNAHAQQVAHLPMATKWAIYYWYYACRVALANRFDQIFTEENASTAESQGWTAVWHSLSGGAFGTLDQVESQPIESLLTEMEFKIKANTPQAE